LAAETAAATKSNAKPGEDEQDMQALLAQIIPTIGEVEVNAHRAAQAVAEHPDADIAVFPELFLSGYTLDALEKVGREPGADELQLIQRAAASAETAVVIGFAERHSQGFADSVACIDVDGQLVAVYRKMLLFGQEADVFTPGDELLIVSLAGLKVAPLICFDIEFPEPARRVAQAGAELLVTASANFKPFAIDHQVQSLSRAVDNRLPHLYVNLVGASGELEFVGGSRSMSPLGEILYEAPADQEDVAVVPVAGREGVDERSDYLTLVPEMPAVSYRSHSASPPT
jgi:predicted amidohydrolase